MNVTDMVPYLAAGIFLLFFFMGLLLLIWVAKLKSWMPDLYDQTREGFIQSGRDLQAVNAQGRQEMHHAIALFQESLLRVVSDNLSVQKQQLDSFEKALDRTTQAMLSRQDVFSDKMEKGLQGMDQRIQTDGFKAREELKATLSSFEKILHDHFARLNQHQLSQNHMVINTIDALKKGVEVSLGSLQKENTRQLGEIRHTVDEKLHETLEKRLGESFQLVSKQLDQVSRGLGEMQTLANGVGDLKKVLSNVKTRGILGEYQLGAILEEILSPHQYARDVITRKGSRDHVEYAVILPGDGEDHHLFIPVDSKFPLTPYENLQKAFDTGDGEAVKACRAALSRAVLGFAKDIAGKYIDPPYTTDFGVMFLPVEGLYAEVSRDVALFEKLQRELHIIITGPTTLAAFLNALQMGFRTLAIQKRSSQVWQVLSTVKTEFGKFALQLDKVEKHFDTARSSLSELKTTRSQLLGKKLEQVEILALDDGKKGDEA